MNWDVFLSALTQPQIEKMWTQTTTGLDNEAHKGWSVLYLFA